MPHRREFLAGLGVLATAIAIEPGELRAAARTRRHRREPGSSWDTSWIPKVEQARYRVVINADTIADGTPMDHAAAFMDEFHEVHGTSDADTRAVIVFRRNGIPPAVNDAMWERYNIGESIKVNDPATHAPARRNAFWRGHAGSSPESAAEKLETLQRRGVIVLVCNVALSNWARGWAERAHADPDAVITEARANLIPGAILVPTGVYALIRAQNAGCAWMPGD